MTDIHTDVLPGHVGAETLTNAEHADSSDFPELPSAWEGKRAELLRKAWPQLSQEQRRHWIAHIRNLGKILAEDNAAFDDLQRMHNRVKQAGLLKLLEDLQAEYATLDPVATEADWEDLQAALNANRAPAPPLFP